jgi:hypothetical protein
MASEAAVSWRHCFQHWPTDIEHRGVIVTSFNEQIAFDGFAIGDEMLLVERRTPDTTGARLVIVPYGHIQALKIVDVAKLRSFQSMGFAAPAPRK